jgi:hypothetical protein
MKQQGNSSPSKANSTTKDLNNVKKRKYQILNLKNSKNDQGVQRGDT